MLSKSLLQEHRVCARSSPSRAPPVFVGGGGKMRVMLPALTLVTALLRARHCVESVTSVSSLVVITTTI